jgi:TatA/E family protein of Tat protein translocase
VFPLFLESTSEIFFILVVALIIFGPRKLPQLSKTIGKSLAEFKRASEEFKRSWETEVAMETAAKDARIEQAMLPEEKSTTTAASVEGYTAPSIVTAEKTAIEASSTESSSTLTEPAHTIASVPQPVPSVTPVAEAQIVQPAGKQDWL